VCVIEGEAVVKAPTEKVVRPRPPVADVRLARHDHLRALLARAKGGVAVPTALAHPCDPVAVAAAVEAAELGLIEPILVGPEAKIRAAAAAAGVDIGRFRQVAAPHSHAAAAAAVDLVRTGEAQALMKGSLHTDELMSAVLAPEAGLRTERRVSHVYVMDVPGYPRPLLITDAAVNIEPDLDAKRDIIRNAIDLAHVLGIPLPKVAILSAVETVSPKLRSTLDAAALCKMADRGQIAGAVLDGPLALDNAVSPEAAREKGLVSPVAGQADVLVAPDLEAANMLAKQLTFLSGADAAGIVLGARAPIILTSRADSARTRIASCALAALVARARAADPPNGAVV
jgi:phosphate butyryltransferase